MSTALLTPMQNPAVSASRISIFFTKRLIMKKQGTGSRLQGSGKDKAWCSACPFPSFSTSLLNRPDEKFLVPLGARERRLAGPPDGQALLHKEGSQFPHHPEMNRRVPDDALLAHLAPAHLELWLDKGKDHP